MKVSKEAKPNGLESTWEKGDEMPQSEGLSFVERPHGHGYDRDKSESEKDALSENRTEETTSETGDS